MEWAQLARLVNLLHHAFNFSCSFLGRDGRSQLGQPLLEFFLLGDLAEEARKIVALLRGDLRSGSIRGCRALEKSHSN